MLYEMVTGRVPFDGSIWEVMRDHCETPPRPPSSLRPGLDARFDALCLKAMAKKPADRYASAKAFAGVLSDYLHGGSGEHEELMLAEEIGDAGEKPGTPRDGSSAAAAFEIDDDTESPASALRETGVASKGSGSARQPAKPATEAPKEVLLCPKCKARLQVTASRTRPVDCPLCNCRFAVAAGRQAFARSTEPKKAPPAEKPRNRRPDRREQLSLDDDEDEILRRDWEPAAGGLRITWMGMLLSGLFLLGIGLTAIASLTSEPSSKSSSYDSKSTYRDSASDSTRSTLHVLYSVFGVGIAVGLEITGIGRFQAGRVPAGVAGGWLATFSAAAQGFAAFFLTIPFLLLYRLMDESKPSSRDESLLVGAASIASALSLLLLVASDFAFTSYLTAIGRHVGRRLRGLTTLAKVVLWILLSCAIIGAAAGGIAVAINVQKASPGVAFFGVLAGASGCLTLAMLPFWGIVMFVLHIRAAMFVGAYARDEE